MDLSRILTTSSFSSAETLVEPGTPVERLQQEDQDQDHQDYQTHQRHQHEQHHHAEQDGNVVNPEQSNDSHSKTPGLWCSGPHMMHGRGISQADNINDSAQQQQQQQQTPLQQTLREYSLAVQHQQQGDQVKEIQCPHETDTAALRHRLREYSVALKQHHQQQQQSEKTEQVGEQLDQVAQNLEQKVARRQKIRELAMEAMRMTEEQQQRLLQYEQWRQECRQPQQHRPIVRLRGGGQSDSNDRVGPNTSQEDDSWNEVDLERVCDTPSSSSGGDSSSNNNSSSNLSQQHFQHDEEADDADTNNDKDDDDADNHNDDNVDDDADDDADDDTDDDDDDDDDDEDEDDGDDEDDESGSAHDENGDPVNKLNRLATFYDPQSGSEKSWSTAATRVSRPKIRRFKVPRTPYAADRSEISRLTDAATQTSSPKNIQQPQSSSSSQRLPSMMSPTVASDAEKDSEPHVDGDKSDVSCRRHPAEIRHMYRTQNEYKAPLVDDADEHDGYLRASFSSDAIMDGSSRMSLVDRLKLSLGAIDEQFKKSESSKPTPPCDNSPAAPVPEDDRILHANGNIPADEEWIADCDATMAKATQECSEETYAASSEIITGGIRQRLLDERTDSQGFYTLLGELAAVLETHLVSSKGENIDSIVKFVTQDILRFGLRNTNRVAHAELRPLDAPTRPGLADRPTMEKPYIPGKKLDAEKMLNELRGEIANSAIVGWCCAILAWNAISVLGLLVIVTPLITKKSREFSSWDVFVLTCGSLLANMFTWLALGDSWGNIGQWERWRVLDGPLKNEWLAFKESQFIPLLVDTEEVLCKFGRLVINVFAVIIIPGFTKLGRWIFHRVREYSFVVLLQRAKETVWIRDFAEGLISKYGMSFLECRVDACRCSAAAAGFAVLGLECYETRTHRRYVIAVAVAIFLVLNTLMDLMLSLEASKIEAKMEAYRKWDVTDPNISGIDGNHNDIEW